MTERRAMNVGLLGTRHVHAGGLAAMSAELGHTVVGAVEQDAQAATAWQEASSVPLMDQAELLEAADAIIVCGTNAERARDAVAALEAGLPVLCEKPIALNEEEISALTHAAGTDGRFMTALPVRFSRAMREARELVQSGYIGTPIGARSTNHGQYPGGWFGDAVEAGGGAMMDHTVHLSDGLCWLLEDRVARVYAVAGTYMHDLEVDDCAMLTVDFAGGAYASIDASWSRPQSFQSWGDVWVELAGSEGRLVIDPLGRNMTFYNDAAGKQQDLGFGDNMASTMLEAFYSYAAEGGESPVSLAEGIHASRVVAAGYESVATGQPVRL